MNELKPKRKRLWRLLIDNKAIFGYMIFWIYNLTFLAFIGLGFGYMIFWIYNLTFLAFIGLGFGPVVLPSVIQGVQVGMIPGFYAAYGAIIIAIPLIAVILGATVLRKHVGKLFLLGYGVQGPLMLVLAVRFFGLGQTTLPIKIIMTVATIGLLTLLWHILDRNPNQHEGWLGYIKAVGLACLLAIGFYASIWILFYAIPISQFIIEGFVEAIKNIPEFFEFLMRDLGQALREGIQFLFFAVFGGMLFIFTATLFALLPLIVPWLYVKTWWKGNQGIGRLPAFGVLTAVFAVIGLSLFAVDRQPQIEAFALLENNPSSPAEARAILDQSDDIRAGLLNSYLARTRYLSAQHELDHIRWMYEDAFDVSFETGLSVQNRYEMIARPFLYHPVEPLDPPENQRQSWQRGSSLASEPEMAAELYEKFFDEPINEGEKEQVVRAVRTTWDPNRAQTAWQAVDDREVLLKEQILTHTDLGDGIHGFELHEIYSNQTATRQEVVYYFSLPETAVITGVWLGDGERGKVFNYRVAPRGAAQQVYQEQVRRNVDPALVEQIGPQQYRLRIFPIDPLRQSWEDSNALTPTIEDGEDMHMWLSWQVIEQDGDIPMPSLSVLRNVYWTDESVRILPAGLPADADSWLPTSMPSSNPRQVSHVVEFPDGRTVVADADAVAPPLPNNLNFAIVLDRSFSMDAKANELESMFKQLWEVSPTADIYLTASKFRGEEPSVKKLNEVNGDDLIFFGGQNSAEIMQQFAELNTGADYDAIIVITDDGTFSTTANETETVAVPDAPVWMLHMGGILPNGYDDNTLEIVQASGGGAANSLEEIYTRLAVFLGGDGSDIINGFRWTVYPAGVTPELSGNVVNHPPSAPFAKIAARQLILAEMRANKGSITDVALLDGLHEIAVDQAIVTPFSSMIVLVNEFQERRLDQLEEREDRFEREVEQVGETAPGPTVTGVPEPEEWLLIILATGMLLWFLWNKKQTTTVPVGLG